MMRLGFLRSIVWFAFGVGLGACGESQADNANGDAQPAVGSPDATPDSASNATPDATGPTLDAAFEAKADGLAPSLDAAVDRASPPPVDATTFSRDGAGDGGSLTSTAIIIRYADVPLQTVSVPPFLVFGSGTIEPSTQFLIIASKPVSCAQPVPPSGGGWSLISIGLPPALLTPGTLPLQSLARSSWAACSSDDCYTSGSGTFTDGTLEILRIEPAVVGVRLTNTREVAVFNTTVAANGTYDAVRCPARAP